MLDTMAIFFFGKGLISKQGAFLNLLQTLTLITPTMSICGSQITVTGNYLIYIFLFPLFDELFIQSILFLNHNLHN
jgi:hypothetical protein